MIIVTGTKRSGTSMWMQILKAAGYPILGEAFPRDWGETIREANAQGFYESPLRLGIYYATNPHPRTGAFLAPDETRRLVVKVFAVGLVKSDLAYVDKVLASMRPWREYKRSLERLYGMERDNKLAKAQRAGRSAETVPEIPTIAPVLEWWNDNYTLIRDALIRRYPLHMISYAAVLREPEQVVREALAWIGGGDIDAAVVAVQTALRTQHTDGADDGASGLSPEHERLFDELYERVDQRAPLDAAFIDRLNDAHEQLAPRIAAAERQAREQRRRARERARLALSTRASETDASE
jgi:hypothetical protein